MKLNSIHIPSDHALFEKPVSSNQEESVQPVSEQKNVNEPQADDHSSAAFNEPSHDPLDTKENQSDNSEAPTGENDNVNNEEPSDDMSEELEKYQKMLRFGVHESAVRQKMLFDGIDPTRLNL